MNIYIMLLISPAALLQLALFHNSFGDSCEAYRFVNEKRKALVDHVIKTMSASLKEVCWDTCVQLPWCFSINVRNTSWGSVECELNNSSKKASPGSLVSREGTDYYQMGDVPDFLNQTVKVKRKEVLEDGWYRYGKSVLKLFKGLLTTWMDARSYCQSLGGDLVSISSHQQNDFVYNVFVKDRMNSTNVLRKPNNVLLFVGQDFNSTGFHWGNVTDTTLEGGVAQFKLDGTDRDFKIHIITGEVRYEVADGRKALYFSGDKALVEIPAVRLTKEFTMVLWIRFLEPMTGFPRLFIDQPFDSFKIIQQKQSKSIKFHMKSDSSSLTKTNDISIEYEKWTHIAIRWTSDDSTTTAEGVINGEIKATLNIPDSFSGTMMTVDSTHYAIGNSPSHFYDSSKMYSFKGHMTNLKMFKRRLSIDEIKKDFVESIDIPDLSAVWIGLRRTNHISPFLWSDGSPPDEVTSEMTSHHMKHLVTNHHCAAAGKDGQWFGRHCLEEKPFICEKPAE